MQLKVGVHDVNQNEIDAKEAAKKHVPNVFQRPDQLEKVDQYKRRMARKKASVDSMRKTAMQSQLDGVRTGLNYQDVAIKETKEIQKDLNEIEEIDSNVSTLASRLQDIKEESMRHCQYAAAMENLIHIFNVPGSVQKTQELIQENKLLLAHQSLADLERSRDDLMLELHKLPNHSPTDLNTLKHYFADVERVSDELARQLWFMLSRTLNTVRKEPKIIVNAIRLVVREEWADEAALLRQQSTNFLPPSRPKQWKKKALEVLEKAVAERIEGNQLEERAENKMWLVRHLEITRQIIFEDLRTAKIHCTPCFPPKWNIFEEYVKMYHRCMSARLRAIIENGLKENEFVTLLGWLSVYCGRELMAHPDLQVEVTPETLLTREEQDDLARQYLEGVMTNYQDWLKNSLTPEVKDWQSENEPDRDDQDCYHTSAPLIVFQLVSEHLQVAQTVGPHLVAKVMRISMEQICVYLAQYRDCLAEHNTQHYHPEHYRTRYVCFTLYLVACANNMTFLGRHLLQLITDYCPNDASLQDLQNQLEHNLATVQDMALQFLCEELQIDLKGEMELIMQRRWLTSGSITIDTMAKTIEDYTADYRHLVPALYEKLVSKIEMDVAKGYVTAIVEKRISFKNPEERRDASDKIVEEGDKLKALFSRLNPLAKQRDSNLEALQLLAEVLRMRDTTLLSLEISGLVKKFPDITANHLLALLELRGDIGRVEARQLIQELKPDTKYSGEQSIFSFIQLGG